MNLTKALGLVIALATVASFACQSRQSNQRKLLIYTAHGQDMLRDFVTRYKQVHPEVDIQFLDMGSREVLERLRAERNRPQADLWWGAAHTTFQIAADENLLAPYRPSWAEKVPDAARDPQDRWYGTYETPEVIVYNSAAVSAADAPKDWDDVLDPKWRDVYQEQKKLPVAYNIPTSGTPVVIDAIALVRGAPHEEEAKRFYEFVTTPESLIHSGRNYNRLPVRTDIDRKQLPDWMNAPFVRMPLDWELLRRQGNEWLRYWDGDSRPRKVSSEMVSLSGRGSGRGR